MSRQAEIIDVGVVVRVAMLMLQLPSHQSVQQCRSLLMTALRWSCSRLNWNELNCSLYARSNPFKKNGLYCLLFIIWGILQMLEVIWKC